MQAACIVHNLLQAACILYNLMKGTFTLLLPDAGRVHSCRIHTYLDEVVSMYVTKVGYNPKFEYGKLLSKSVKN